MFTEELLVAKCLINTVDGGGISIVPITGITDNDLKVFSRLGWHESEKTFGEVVDFLNSPQPVLAKSKTNPICLCGHDHNSHAEIRSHNYTAGKCSLCDCEFFIIDTA